ncbi:BBP7 family outer membrane beta-barrel protein [Stieleria varia]|uniref:Uncharacterized protein n=1 Tax=Stieleria varia TaxID=2528005 RepID=A0A5C6AXL9_9BACT|nr:BBP7 family outer membrane beta-barrel protein [Stieleria varia]TWU04470.1 hypothetical protein Pla52n_25110 [Stieleria varia]
MSKKFRGMTLAALLLSASTSAMADNNEFVYGDAVDSPSPAFVGDLSTEDAYYGDQYVAPAANVRQVSRDSGYATAADYAPAVSHSGKMSMNQLQPAGYFGDSAGCGCSPGCDSIGCDGGCDSACSSGKCRGSIASALGMCDSDGWASFDALLWFVSDRNSPVLAAEAPATIFPVLDDPQTRPVFGGQGAIEGGLSGGFRSDVGRYLSDDIGVGGRFWWLGENESSYANAGDGSPTSISIGRPYYDTNLGGESALLGNQANFFAGGVTASESLDMWGAEAYARMRFHGNKSSRLEFIGGYSHFEIDNDLDVASVSVDVNTARRRTFADRFNTENEFNGGQIGFETTVRRGRWTATSLTKVHLGNMAQSVSIRGNSTDTLGAVTTTANSGLLAMGNQGDFRNDVFTFVPEMNFKLGYRFRDHIDFNVGYSFLYFESVALAGEQIDRLVDSSQLGTNAPFGARPAFSMVEGDLFVQGLDLGMTISY